MRIRIVGIAALAGIVLASSVVANHGPVSASADATSGHYLALGDSLAFGDGASSPEHNGYVPRVARAFNSLGPGFDPSVNLAVKGETSTSFIDGGQLVAAVASVSDPSTDIELVTLDIGGNDLLALLKAGPCTTDPQGTACALLVAGTLQQFGNNFGIIVGTVAFGLANDPGSEKFLVMTYYNPWDGTGSQYEAIVDMALFGMDGIVDCAAIGANPYNAGMNDIITCVGQQFGAEVVDVYSAFDGQADALTHIGENNFHPNNHGYQVIAEEFIAVLRSE